jgi:5-(aminomethyl)-3-furanmethanol phosphate kinase
VTVRTVVKIGGALLAAPAAYARATAALARAPRDGGILVVPGGGPFADVVRAVDRQFDIGDDAAHWAAILGMDQYAYVLAATIPGAALVESADESQWPAARLPVLAPSRWLRAADALPHSWDVTADSIAAWIARAVGARRLLLVKLDDGTDPYLSQAAPPGCGLDVLIVRADAPSAAFDNMLDV